VSLTADGFQCSALRENLFAFVLPAAYSAYIKGV